MNSLPAKADIRQWHPGPLSPEISQALERLTQTEDVRYVAVMPDVHLANEVCTGTVLATARRIYPQAVGNDIGCGMAALAFDSQADLLANEQAAARVLAGLYRTVPSLRHSRRTMLERLPEELALSELSHHRLEKEKTGMAECNSPLWAEVIISSNSRWTNRAYFGSWSIAVLGQWAKPLPSIT